MKYLKKLNQYFRKHKKSLLLGVLYILLSNGFQVVIPLFLRDSIDLLKNKINYDLLLQYALLILGAAVLSGFFRFMIRQSIIVVSRKIEYDLRQDFWSHLQKLSLNFYQNNTTGNLMAHATNDIGAIRMYTGPGVMYTIDTSTKLIISLIAMITISPELTLYSLIPMPILSYFVYKVSQVAHEKYLLIQEKFSELTTKVQENFSGIRVIKSYVREQSEINDFEKMGKDYLSRNMEMVKVRAAFMPGMFLISGLSIIIVIWLGGIKVINNDLTIGDITAFTMYLGFLIWPMIAFGWIMNIFQQASASMKRLLKIFDTKIDIKDNSDTLYNINAINGEIVFKNVSFRYGEKLPYVIKNISLKIPSGTTAAIIGKTGCGKSTLLNLIPRFFDIEEGEILIDGINIKKIPLQVLRRSIGYVTQDTFLFSDTLRNNILFSVDSNNELLKDAISISRIDKDIENFPDGLETMLGERGITLSGGQKQRTSIARAIASNPQILILDDSLSAVDTATEEEILVQLKSYLVKRTAIIVSHRISTVKNADIIYVLNEGEIVEQGTHNELLNLDGIYSDMYNKQLLEEELSRIE